MRAARHLAREFLRAHPADAAPVLEQLPLEEVTDLLESLPTATAAACLESLVSTMGAECLTHITNERAGMILEELPPDVAALLLLRLSSELQQRLLSATPPETAESLRRRLRYREGTAGALVQSRVLSFPDQITVGEALLRQRKQSHQTSYYVYVVDRDKRLVGVLTLRELMLAPPKKTLSSVMNPEVTRLSASADRSDILAHAGWRQFQALPVVDGSGRFLGIVEHQAAKRLELEEPSSRRTYQHGSLGLAFAELCWSGMTSVLEGVARAALQNQVRPEAKNGERDGV